jgi:hypothetical protein
MHRATREDFSAQCIDFEYRLKSSYARRMLADPSYTVVLPAVELVRKAIATWRRVFIEDALPAEEAEAIRAALLAAAQRLEIPCRQGRLLAQAALVPLKEVLDSSGLAQKPKKRRSGDPDEDTHPILERSPKDPSEPTHEELEELHALERD